MWAITNHTPYKVESTWGRDKEGVHEWIVAVKETFDIKSKGSLTLADEQIEPLLLPEYNGKDGLLSLRYDANLVVPKPKRMRLTPEADASDPLEIKLDGKRIVFNAEEKIVLRYGKASITLTQAVKVLIRGAYLLNQSSGVNRIKGGSDQLKSAPIVEDSGVRSRSLLPDALVSFWIGAKPMNVVNKKVVPTKQCRFDNTAMFCFANT